MSNIYDLGPAAAEVNRLVDGVTHDQMTAPTPCEAWTVNVLLEHLLGLTTAFTSAATKAAPPPAASQLTGDLPTDWTSQLHERLDALAAAWRAPRAWEGEAEAGGVTMPADVMGVVALDELVVHGWDLAQATGQTYTADPTSVQASMHFAASMSQPGDESSREGLYGPAVTVPDGAAPLDRLLGLTGRDPHWDPHR